MECIFIIVMRILQPTIEKKSVEKRHLFQRVILAGTLEATWVKGHPRFLCGRCVCKIHQFGRHIPVYLTYVKFLPLPSAIGPSWRGTQIVLISSIYGLQRYENFATKLWKKKLCRKQWKGRAKITLSKWCPYSKGIFRWSTTVKRHPKVQAGFPTLSP